MQILSGKQSRKAFSLVELSIVIVLIGLLMAATMVGKDLLNAARLRSVISEIEGYKIAVDNFKTQYNNLPGDIPNATSFWTTVQNGGTSVNNGDGNGQIGIHTTATDYTEPFYVWNHLTLSKFIPGTFSGYSTVSVYPDVNVPKSKYISCSNCGYAIRYFNGVFGYKDAVGRTYKGNFLNLGSLTAINHSSGPNYFSNTLLSSADTYYIDSKIDDGRPNYGKMFGNFRCTTGTSPNLSYNTSSDTNKCMILITLD